MKKITPKILKSWNPCQSGYDRYCELYPKGADLKTALDGLVADGHAGWAYWLFQECQNTDAFKDQTLSGYRNSGDLNSGDLNSGNLNSGNLNSGNLNSGYRNSGYRNSGYRNSGDLNSGNLNSGNLNSGNLNSGYLNSGYLNSGDRNSGYLNSGNLNSGNLNSGDLNSGNYNVGHFNSTTPEEISVFNKPCKREVWDNAYKPRFIWFDLTYWIDENDMTDQEKADDPGFHVRGGQLRTRGYKEAWQHSWDSADPADKNRIKDLPNFDAAVFEDITGIKIKND